MGWFSTLVGADDAVKVADNFVDKGMTILDEAFDTKDERRQYFADLIASWTRQQEIITNQKSPTAVSRRVVAAAVLGMVASLLFASLYLIMTSEQLVNEAGRIYLSNEAKLNAIQNLAIAFSVGWAFVAVIVFYFGPHVLSKLRGGGNISGGEK